MDKQIMILSEGFERDRHVMSINEALKEIECIINTSQSEYYDYLDEYNLDDNCFNSEKFKNTFINVAKKTILEESEYIIHGVTYKVLDDEIIEKLWDELGDVLFDETDNDLVLSNDWFIFDKGTEKEDVWRWFDEHHSKGVGYLMNEYEK